MVTTNDHEPFTGSEGPRVGVVLGAQVPLGAVIPSADAPQGDVVLGAVAPGSTGVAEPPAGPNRHWRRIVVPVAAAAVAAALAIGATVAVMRPPADRVRHQRDAVQVQLDQTATDLAAAQTQAAKAETTVTGCKRLADDSAAVVDQLSKLEAIFVRYSQGNVVSGSQEDIDLSQQGSEIRSSLILLRGSMTSDRAICAQTPTTA